MTRETGGLWPVILCDWPALRTVEMIPGTRRTIREAAVRLTGCAELADDIGLMASELLANAAQHGTGEKMHVRVSSRGQAVRVEVRDAGPPPRAAKEPMDPLGERGRGLLLVAALSCRWGLEHDGEGTTAWFEAQPKAASA